MNKHTPFIAPSSPGNSVEDPLTELLRDGANKLIRQAVQSELDALLAEHQEYRLPDGRQALVRNGYLPERCIQTGLGHLEVKVPKVRDRGKQGIVFNSSVIPPYLKRSKQLDELIPWLYLKGVSTGDYQEALSALFGESAKGLSSNTIARLKTHWEAEHQEWQSSDLSAKRYVYWWVDGVHCRVRMDDKLCLLVIIGVTEHGHKELVAVEDGYRESAASWEELLISLRARGLEKAPQLAVGDGAMGFWAALTKVYPQTAHQRCWVHKTANVLNKVPKSVQPKIKSAIHEIWMAETRADAEKAFDKTVARFESKYPNAMHCLAKDRMELLAFYDYPSEHWTHIRTTNPIESAFATVRLRTAKTRGCGSRKTTLAMVFKLMQSAEKSWRKIRGFRLLTLVINNTKFKDGELVKDQLQEDAA